nr:hypothetical protein GCM10025699_50500 [Microbacterium flavescens]
MAARATGRPAKKTGVVIDQVGWEQIRPAAVILVSGPEQFLADRAVRQLRDQLVAEDPSLEVNDLEADHYQPGELITLASPSLFAEPRLIRVANVEKCTDAFLTETLRYLESPADDTYLVLRHGGGVRGKKLLDTVRSGAGGGSRSSAPNSRRTPRSSTSRRPSSRANVAGSPPVPCAPS